MKKRDFPPIHPGEILSEEFLKPMGISQYRLALSIHVPARRINEIVMEKRGITADTALRLSRFFGNSAEFWMNLQKLCEINLAESKSGKTIRALPVIKTRRGDFHPQPLSSNLYRNVILFFLFTYYVTRYILML